MLADFDLFQVDAFAASLGHKLCHVVEDKLGDGFAPHGRENPEGDDAPLGKPLELSQFRVVRRREQRVVKHFMQPDLDRLEAAEVKAPVTLVKLIGGENEPEGKSIAVH